MFRVNIMYILAMFLLMSTFFIYPANFAMETVSEGIIPQNYIAVIMAGMDFVAFCGGLLFVRAKRLLGGKTKFLAPLCFLIGYLLLALLGGWTGTLLGSVFVGFANGAGIPYIMSEASMKAGKAAATTVMPLISADPKRKSRVKDCFIDLRPFLCYDNTVIILVQKGVFSWKIRLKI